MSEKKEETEEPVFEDECVDCPFCSEADFDLVGLKSHLVNGYCGVFNQLKPLRRLF